MTRRLLLSYLTITVIVLVVLEVPLARFYQQRETERLTVGVERDANALASLYEDALEQQTPIDPAIAATYARAHRRPGRGGRRERRLGGRHGRRRGARLLDASRDRGGAARRSHDGDQAFEHA